MDEQQKELAAKITVLAVGGLMLWANAKNQKRKKDFDLIKMRASNEAYTLSVLNEFNRNMDRLY